MAHYAQTDSSGVVLQIVVISNDDIRDETGIEQEPLGVAVCEAVVGLGPWVQTSYHGSFRRRYAGIGMTYSTEHDAFILPQPFSSWTLDLDDPFDWVPPVPEPDRDACEGGYWEWNEEGQDWECKTPE
jgi:hypothetical protein